MDATLKVSRHRYFAVPGYDLPKRERKYWATLLDDLDEQEFLHYRGAWYCLGDCEVVSDSLREFLPLTVGWDGHWTDTYFSMILCRYDQDTESYRMALLMS